MSDKIKVFIPLINGSQEEAFGENIEILESKEPWSEYLLENGVKVRLRQATIAIVKLDEKKADGSDSYVVQGQPLIQIIPKQD